MAGIHVDGFLPGVIHKREPITGFQLEMYVTFRIGVIVDGHRNRDLVALRQRDWEIEIHEKVLKDLEARSRRAEVTVLRGGQHGHTPRSDIVRERYGNAGITVAIRDDLRIDIKRLGKVGTHVNVRRSLLVRGQSYQLREISAIQGYGSRRHHPRLHTVT